jgi:hypothetical protein
VVGGVVLPMGLGSRPTGGLAMVPAEALVRSGLEWHRWQGPRGASWRACVRSMEFLLVMSGPLVQQHMVGGMRSFQAMYACMTFPCIPVWTAWLQGGSFGDEDLGHLFESLGGVVTERTLGRLHAVQSLAREDRYYVDLGQWTVALGGLEAVALIPVICGILFGREVQVPMSGITVAALYSNSFTKEDSR